MTSSIPELGQSLLDRFPALSQEWHPTKNGALQPSSVKPGSGKKVWWLAKCGHEWDAPPTSRTSKSSGCPICAGKRVVVGINDFETLSPELASEWHPTKNGSLKPNQVSAGSDKRVWWLGVCGHEWDVGIGDRVKYSTGCPFCKGNLRVMLGINDFGTLQPVLSSEWHPSKNRDLVPSGVREFSMKKIWWLGPCGHEWVDTAAHRSSGRNCPYCSGKKLLIGFNDIQTTDPSVAAEWHPTKNDNLKPTMVTRGSDKKVWWYSHGHQWKSIVSSRTISKQGCAICSGDQVHVGINDLETTHPQFARMWNRTRNGSKTASEVTAGSAKRYWWDGECGHTWKATVSHITAGRGCAICRGLQIEIEVNDLASQLPDLAAQWHPTKNGTLSPQQVTTSSAKKVWWQCYEGHEWRVGVNGRQYGRVGCPSCATFGFHPSKEGWLYFLVHPIWDMQQIGISNVPESRISQHKRGGWQVIEVRGPMDGQLAQNLEQNALVSLSRRGANLGVPSSTGGFDGHTEAWSTHTLKLESMKQLFDWIYEDDLQITEVEHIQAWAIPEKKPRQPVERANCSVHGCERKTHGSGYCRLHYRRWKATGNPGSQSLMKRPNGSNKTSLCLVEGCPKSPRAKGFCSMHYARWTKTGDPGEVKSRASGETDRTCVVEGCDKPWMSKKMCETHYRRYKSNGDPLIIKSGGKPRSFCTVDVCDRPAFGKGYCNMHYKRFRRTGNPLIARVTTGSQNTQTE